MAELNSNKLDNQVLLEERDDSSKEENKKKKKRKKIIIVFAIIALGFIIYYIWSTRTTVVQPRNDSSVSSSDDIIASSSVDKEYEEDEKQMNGEYYDFMTRINPFTFANHNVVVKIATKENEPGFTTDQWNDGYYIEAHDGSKSIELFIKDTTASLHTADADGTDHWYTCVMSTSDTNDFYDSIINIILSQFNLSKIFDVIEGNPSILYQKTIELNEKKYAIFALDLNETASGDPGEDEYAKQQEEKAAEQDIIDYEEMEKFTTLEEIDAYLNNARANTDMVTQVLYYLNTSDSDAFMDHIEAIYADNQSAVIDYADGIVVDVPSDTGDALNKSDMVDMVSSFLADFNA